MVTLEVLETFGERAEDMELCIEDSLPQVEEVVVVVTLGVALQQQEGYHTFPCPLVASLEHQTCYVEVVEALPAVAAGVPLNLVH